MLKKMAFLGFLAWVFIPTIKDKGDAIFLAVLFGVIYLVYLFVRQAWRSGADEADANRYLAGLQREKDERERNGR
jgi:threonine/homoserine/homoserine lactone efflux protein